MTGTTAVDPDALWAAIDDQRSRTAQLLEDLAPDQWDHPSLCDGWTVRHVAAHLTMQRERLHEAAGFVARHPRMLRSRGLNAFIHDAAVVQARALSSEEVVERIRAGIGSRRHNAFVTPLETLTDILVHSQDIAIPLGLELDMRPKPSAVAATRRWDTRTTWLARVNRRLPLEGFRLVATDTEWTRGDGPPITGPIGAILLLLTGRTAALGRLDGEGTEVLRTTRTASP
ncbi:maleylpyruvate isomerase family mycothiol-dependent enzyme [Phycicoccus sp. M110.8]|uniref:maleylpyruvate isomerase family mycothiol-dependent enzyme n=1 Tax=Phycicoccus sp. M110.8 TaxID=3075433 RepID=UPI0028FD43E6|nr:maleylpyruvate isomerase family mycothiol-dependent enzyme [Phycicoccus sp. M110.8]MDU0312264.1 maleylpyruvate isomerase family mycothiol-dependent enzyme [Phycicoccus sp. M110.8]